MAKAQAKRAVSRPWKRIPRPKGFFIPELTPFNAGEILDAITTLKGTLHLIQGQTVFAPSRFIRAIQQSNSVTL